MKIALFGKNFAEDRFIYFQQLIDKLKLSGISIAIYSPFYEFVKGRAVFAETPVVFATFRNLDKDTDFLFSVGGDGTMLDAITIIRDSGIPIMGINLGRMGFLSSISKTEIGNAIDAVLEGNYTCEDRALLSVETGDNLFGDLNYALNEFTINKKDSGSMVLVHVFVNDLLLNSYWADGLIVSTPTGSTAYSLSCNGPIITPDSENFVITPIAAHNLTVRPVVIPDKSVIKIIVDGRMTQYLASLDSRSVVIQSSAEVLVRKASFTVKLVQPRNYNFFTTIRQKLLWGQDIRN